MARRFATFKQFWPYYVAQHAHPANRALHFLDELVQKIREERQQKGSVTFGKKKQVLQRDLVVQAHCGPKEVRQILGHVAHDGLASLTVPDRSSKHSTWQQYHVQRPHLRSTDAILTRRSRDCKSASGARRCPDIGRPGGWT